MKHPLITWLFKNGESLQQFAKRIGVNPSTVQRLLYGKSDVTTTLIRTVSEATNGQVSEQVIYSRWLLAYRERTVQREPAD